MSKIFQLKLNDFTKGLVIAILMAVLTVLQQMITKSFNAIDWTIIVQVALGAAIAYLIKNLSTNEEGKVLGKF